MLPGNSGTCWLDVLPSFRVSCANVHGLLDGVRGPKASVWPDCGVGIGRPKHARQVGVDDCRADAILEEISRILSENSKLAIAKWRDDMKNRGLAALDGSRADPLLVSTCNIM